MRIAVLASGEGTTLQAVADAIQEGRLDAELSVVVSNNSNSGALARAAALQVPAHHLSSVTHPEPTELDSAICNVLSEREVNLVVLAGYMKKIGPLTLSRFAGRILNTHPALLPRHGGKGMYGRRVHEAVLASGDVETGVSVHLVDAEYDTGATIAQARCPVSAGISVEELERQVRELERRFLCFTLQQISHGEITL
jgi:phosphoribosylglycinamide formyltransferase-1